MKVVLITGENSSFLAGIAERLCRLPGVTFENVVFWRSYDDRPENIKNIMKQQGLIYWAYLFLQLIDRNLIQNARLIFDTIFLIPKAENSLNVFCSRRHIELTQIKDIHSVDGTDYIRSLDADLLVVCGAGIPKKSVIDLSKMGAICLHLGDAQKFRGMPPGFWELWNDAKEAAVTIHFIKNPVELGDVVLKKSLPIFEYDDLKSVHGKLEELALELCSEAIKNIVEERYEKNQQKRESGTLYPYPTLHQKLQLYLKLKRRHFHLLKGVRWVIKKCVFPVGLILVTFRDFLIRTIAKKNILSVLYYHRVTDVCQDGMTVSLNEFEWQVRFLKNNYQLVSASNLEDWLEDKSRIKGKQGVLITFDDGYEDNYTNAMPILKKYSCPAIYFVSTGMIDNDRQFQHDQELHPGLNFKKMTWAQLKEVSGSNIEIGVHSDTHVNMARIPINEAIHEFEISVQKYKEVFGKNPDFMSYPFGGKYDITREVTDYIKKSGKVRMLFSAYGNKNISPIDRWNLKRINIGSRLKGSTFWYVMEGGIVGPTLDYIKNGNRESD